MLKGSAHGVLSSDGSYAKLLLRLICSEQSREGHSPFFGILSQSFKIFLEAEINVLKFRSAGDEL